MADATSNGFITTRVVAALAAAKAREAIARPRGQVRHYSIPITRQNYFDLAYMMGEV
jgi:hypothetical protein